MFFKKKKEADENGNKRQYDRIDFVQASYYRIINDSQEQTAHECWFNNISVGGFSVDIPSNGIAEGDRLMVLYKIGVKMRKDRVVVRFIRKALNNLRLGCEFVDDDIERTSLILDYIDSNLK
ncbi:MAG TPA: PilZ domain-containing protein [Spirochaetota bacterium]|nr:PilZ domain-containing protein [Spirochaetota bacterium]HPU86828.1 PilZ domain-containing protein [Spirochaetota bacterium]